MSSALAGMEVAFEQTRNSDTTYRREQFKATGHLLTFSALYSSYIDVCRRIREKCNLAGVTSYNRAINRVINRPDGIHDFAKDLRNFLLHYQIFEPDIEIHYGNHRTVKLFLKSHDLLYSGYTWKRGSRNYLQKLEKVDVIEMMRIIISDVSRLVIFHDKLVDKRLTREKYAYENYLNERQRYRHLQRAVTDIPGAFGRNTTLSSRLLEKALVEKILRSALPNEKAKLMLMDHANMHQNLPPQAIATLEGEIDSLLETRPNFPVGGSYLSGRDLASKT